MHEYQTFELRGEQELVRASCDEEGLPCVFLHSINSVFPNTRSIFSYGVQVPFSTDRWGQQKMPLRIPYFENRVLEVVTGDTGFEWSRDATATRIAAAVAAGISYSSSNTERNTVHTDPLPGILSDNDDDDDDNMSIDMIESDASSFGEVVSEDEEDEQEYTQPTSTSTSVRSTQDHVIVHSLERITLRPPPFNAPAIPEDQVLPSYELVDSGTIHLGTQAEHVVNVIPTILDDPAERHLVHSRIEFIRRISKKIIMQDYGSAECAHPPLFIILPENPLQWSPNILHNKMRLHFLCDRCMHEMSLYTGSNSPSSTNQRNIHAVGPGFEIRLDHYPDQQLFIKFGHYILNLLRMLQYGVYFDGYFVAAAFDRMVPPLMSGATAVAGKMDVQLFFKFKTNVERSIAFMEALLGDDYEDEQVEMISRLDTNDFRLLDQIVKRPPYAQAVGSTKLTATVDHDRDPSLTDCYQGGSGLYKVWSQAGCARWACENLYKHQHEALDKVFADRLKYLQASMNSHTRAAIVKATNDQILTTRIISVSKIRALFRIDLTLDWVFEKDQLNVVTDTLRHDATSVSSIALRFGKKVPSIVWKDGRHQQQIDGVVNLLKLQQMKHAILEGDVDLMTIPNIGTMDLSNLDVLCMIKTNNRPTPFTAPQSSQNGATHLPVVAPLPKAWTQDIYIPRLTSFLQSCGFLTEISLGFPDVVPGHIRILQTCITALTRLRRLDLFRVINSHSANSSGPVLRRLELSANFSASHTTRLHLSECKTVGDGKARLLESLEELLLDEGAYLEDLELRFIGFNDKHAHALEFGTRRVNGQHSCRLRRLVIHGNGLESRGASAFRRVIKRATRFRRMSDLDASAGYIPAPAQPEEGELSFGNMMVLPTLTHLELCSLDSVDDADWARLLSGLTPTRLITLDLQGVWLGDEAMAALARAHNQGPNDANSSSSPPLTPLERTSPTPPAFFSASASLELQTLRLSCSTLSCKGVAHLQGFLSRLIHLSTLSLRGFRRVSADDWRGIMGRIEFRWIETVEIVSSGVDDGCALYLGERLKAREQTLSSLTESDAPEVFLPPYSERPQSVRSTTSSSSMSSTTTSTSPSSTGRRDSFSSRLFSIGSMGSLTSTAMVASTTASTYRRSSSASSSNNKGKSESEAKRLPPRPRPNPSQKYLEIDLRYTDVSAKGLVQLRRALHGQAKKVVVRMRDDEEEEEEDDDDEGVWNVEEERMRQDHHQHQSSILFSAGLSSSAGAAAVAAAVNGGGGGGGRSSSSGSRSRSPSGAGLSQQQQPNRSSTFSKFKGAFSKNKK
ncbi:hypothetical protein BG006_009601 [Podila minutissima]|uniref:Uncharacterized protein n=1 Tax=Podila minutissima TaxID=64525 RepID=A0A9P5VJA4_9FUNG|nr:hypothetical protein BG006_009601 [Podila minutissima]